jgi:4-aminobutyrate aminotransferase / (S)-3-amino-2-methylpropionate transaminase
MKKEHNTRVTFPGGEATSPFMATSLPGPNAVKYMEELGKMTCNLTQHFPIDLDKSKGNYICDTDGNTYLDMFNSIACIGLGYNHPEVVDVSKSNLMTRLVTNRTALGINPPKEYLNMLQTAFFDVAPKGLTRVGPMMCGSCAVEGAYKASFFAY